MIIFAIIYLNLILQTKSIEISTSSLRVRFEINNRDSNFGYLFRNAIDPILFALYY